MKAGSSNEKAQLKYSGSIMRHWYWHVAVIMLLLCLTAIVLYMDTPAGLVTGGFSLFIFALTFLIDLIYRPKVLAEMLDFSHSFSGVEKELVEQLETAYALAQPDGRIVWLNHKMAEICGKDLSFHKNINNLFPEITSGHFPTDDEEKTRKISIGDKKYLICMHRIEIGETLKDSQVVDMTGDQLYVIAIHLDDITELSRLEQENFEQRPVVGSLYLDNYDEVMESVEDVRRSMLEALIDRKINKYITAMGGLVKKLEKDKYLLVTSRKGLQMMEEDRFSILEDVKTVNIGNAMSITVSIGIATENGDYTQNFDVSRVAIEMALARGGDQAVIRVAEKLSFYGGKTQRAERNTRVRARVKAQALRQLISSSERVIVMGHKNTDIDSLGAAVGVALAAKHVGKPAYIVLGDINSGISPWVELLDTKDPHEESLFLTHEKAIELTNNNTAVVVVDVNRPKITECEELLYLTKTIVVIDHHRQATEKVENASLSYIEPSASSACEMIAEILQYYDDNIRLKTEEADCIYAGIIVDTNSFVAKTGMRTFEAAAFLRRSGADTTRVRKMFRNDMNTYKARAEAVRNAETFMDCYAISLCPSQGLENPTVVGAQAANELLNIIGVKASFVLTEFAEKIFISARAIDEVNVQLVMERLGGGGHLDIAGAQLTGVTADEARVKLKEVLSVMTKEGDI